MAKNAVKGLNANPACTITLVFSDLSHREAWLHRQGALRTDADLAEYLASRHESAICFAVQEEALEPEIESELAGRLEEMMARLEPEGEDDESEESEED